MHFSPVVIAALAAAVSAAPEGFSSQATTQPTPTLTNTVASPSYGSVQVGATSVPTSGPHRGAIVSLLTRKGKKGEECFIRVASEDCNGDSEKLSEFDPEKGCYHENPSIAATDAIFPRCHDSKGEFWFQNDTRTSDGPPYQAVKVHPGSLLFLDLAGGKEMISGPAFDLGLQPGCGAKLNATGLTWTKDCKNVRSNFSN